MGEARIKAPSPLISLAIALWGAALGLLFLIFQTHSVARILDPGALFFFKPRGALALDVRQIFYTAIGTALAGLIVLSWHGLGSLIAKLVRVENEDPLLSLVRTTAWGAGLWSLVWLLLGLAKLYNGWVAVTGAVIGIALFAISSPLKRSAKSTESRPDGGSRVLLALLIFVSLLALLASLAPPTAKDTLLYHFSLPKAYLAAGGIVEVPYNIAGYLPLGAEMHSVWAMLLGNLINARVGEAAAGATQYAFYPLLLAGVYGWTRGHVGRRRPAAMAALIIGSIPTAYYVAANAYVDLALALYMMLAIYAIGRWWVRQDKASLVCFALAFGFALCIKLTAAFLAFSIVVLVMLKANVLQKSGHAVKGFVGGPVITVAAATLAAALLASPWYLKTCMQTGSPVFPLYLNIWEGSAPGWDVERSLMFQIINSTYGGYPKTAIDYLLVPLRLSLTARLEEPTYFDGVLGASFLLGAPILIWALWQSRLHVELKIAAALSSSLFLFWLFSSQQVRYLLPATPGLAVAIACSAELLCTNVSRGSSRLITAAFGCTTITALLVISIWFLIQNPLPVLIGSESRTDYLSRRIDYFPYYDLVNRTLPPNARVWLINMRRDSYHLDRPYFSDYMFEDHTLKKYVDEARLPGDIKQLALKDGITHVLMRYDVLLDFNRTPLVEPRRSLEENMFKLKLFQKFLSESGGVIKADQKFILIDLTSR